MSYRYPFHTFTSKHAGLSISSLKELGDLSAGKALGQAKIDFYANMTTGNLVVKDVEKTIQLQG
ncbi:unnamed protein product, partial [marine sediment metagenome]